MLWKLDNTLVWEKRGVTELKGSHLRRILKACRYLDSTYGGFLSVKAGKTEILPCAAQCWVHEYDNPGVWMFIKWRMGAMGEEGCSADGVLLGRCTGVLFLSLWWVVHVMSDGGVQGTTPMISWKLAISPSGPLSKYLLNQICHLFLHSKKSSSLTLVFSVPLLSRYQVLSTCTPVSI